MELGECSLRHAKLRPPADEAVLAGILLQLLLGVAEVHRVQLLRRDLKPANVILKGGDLELCDFGGLK
eukprot:1890456-Alexandrium_andersonii.AAC.1